MENYGLILLATLGPFLIKFVLFLIAFRIRVIHISLLNCAVVAGAPQMFLFVAAVLPFGLPPILTLCIVLGGTMWLITRYTEAELFPDVIGITLAVEILMALIMRFGISPLFPENSFLRSMLP